MTIRPRPNRLGMYTDVFEVLDAALASNGGSYTLPSHGKAVNWRHRAYRARKLWAEVHGANKLSKYDKLTMPKVPEESATVIIRFISQAGTFIPNEPGSEVVKDDPLFDIARNLADKIEGE